MIIGLMLVFWTIIRVQKCQIQQTMWNDFDSVYYDGEVAVTNPVDIKFNMVRIINYNHK